MFKAAIACLLLVACGSEADNSPEFATGGSGSAASLTEATGGDATVEATGGATAAVMVTGGATAQATGGRASTGGQTGTGGGSGCVPTNCLYVQKYWGAFSDLFAATGSATVNDHCGGTVTCTCHSISATSGVCD